MKTDYFKSVITKSMYMLFALLIFSHCTTKVQIVPKTNDELVMTEYIASNSDFSEFNKLLISAKLGDILSIRGPYTLFLPTNDAMFAYYIEKNIKSYADLDSTSQKNLVYNHIVPQEYSTAVFQWGTLKTKNALGDNIVTEFEGPNIIINKYAKIFYKPGINARDIQVSNGTIQIIDKVLDPVTLNVYDLLAAPNSGYSIFAEGLKRTGLKDTLQIISFKYGQASARTRYTILAIADTTFKRFGINSIDDLINKYTTRPDSIIYPRNGFYDYMDFHCLDRAAYYFSDFPKAATLYSVLSKNNNLQIRNTNDTIKINQSSTGTFTGIYKLLSDIPAKNGVIHTIDKLLEVSIPAPTTIIWEVTDFFDFKQGEFYFKHFQKFFDTAQFAGIRWKGDYLQYYIKDASLAQTELNNDCLNMPGFWDITVTTPKFMKGHYTVASRVWTGIAFAVYIDDVQTAIFTSANTGSVPSSVASDNTNLYNFGEVIWTTTTQHKIRLVAQSSNTLFWDRIELQPIQ